MPIAHDASASVIGTALGSKYCAEWRVRRNLPNVGLANAGISVLTAGGELKIPIDGRQRPLIDFEDTFAEILRERYALPTDDQVTPAVWARASIGALRTSLVVSALNDRTGAPPARALGDTLRACFAALQRGI